ncbi:MULTISPECIES: AI-2E family transporter [Campylobacter]|uniref:AI-2E family transporter n=1 Tax=Campylobacter vicugnae TaxID=1660076 RepID=A0ABZ2E7L8_9BACT|nr:MULTISPECIES: AI-2E family transporter [unclassified Campylobacter]ARR04666.1 putative autoinducer 2 transporter [Campylobacter sp. RM12175]MCR8690525.1 AI-2E family transporter [Campylobacter sp. RM9264]MCR8701397.1 AI-2E family transporter [Campylobacter sp. RM12176]
MRYNLVAIASFIIIIGGLSLASSIVVPFLLAVFISIIVYPVLELMSKVHINRFFAFIILIGICGSGLWILGNVIATALLGFSADLPIYKAKIDIFIDNLVIYIKDNSNIDISNNILSFINIDKLIATTSNLIVQTGSIVTQSFLVFLLLAFILFEVQIFKDKVAYFALKNPLASDIASTFISNLKRYLAIKTISSIATGVIVWIFLILFDVPYAPLWAVLAFILNYIPTIGSIIAAIPAILVSLAVNDLSSTLWLTLIYLVLNIAIGNFIEPKFLGKELGISTLVVILSLLFWGFVFGIGGMFLAVPLTMSIKIALDANPKTKSISILLSN